MPFFTPKVLLYTEGVAFTPKVLLHTEGVVLHTEGVVLYTEGVALHRRCCVSKPRVALWQPWEPIDFDP
jgi:hypothetical protein